MRKFDNVEKVRLNKKGLKAMKDLYADKDIPKGVGEIMTYDEMFAPEVGVQWKSVFLYVPEDLLESAEVAKSRFKPGDKVKLNKAGSKSIKKEWDLDMTGNVGYVCDVGTDPTCPGSPYVEFDKYSDYIPSGFLMMEDEYEFPMKVRGFEVRIGDTLKDFEGEKFRVYSVRETTDGTEQLLFQGKTVDEGFSSYEYSDAKKKIKIYGREYL